MLRHSGDNLIGITILKYRLQWLGHVIKSCYREFHVLHFLSDSPWLKRAVRQSASDIIPWHPSVLHNSTEIVLQHSGLKHY